jgi:hypothetical protein
LRSSSSWAVGSVKVANVALPIEPTVPYCAMPTSLNGRTGLSVATLTVSPTL